MRVSPDHPFWVNDWQVDPTSGRIQLQGAEVKLEPKVMAVLVCLAQHAGTVVSREHLENTVWAGMVVGYDSLASTIIKLRKAFNEDSKQPRIIETVPKRGYRLIASVSAEAPPVADATPISTTRTLPVQPTWFGLGILAIALLLGALVWLALQPGQPAPPPSIAVLPFKNLSNDPAQDYFSDGMTADLITDLSQLSGLSVIARNSAFAYKQENVDIRNVGKELGVAYILEGSVRKAGDTLRITARLIDTATGYNLWAARFDSALEDVFALQDEVTEKIVDSLKIQLTDKEKARLAHQYTDSIEAYDKFLRGWEGFWAFSAEGNELAKNYYRQAIELDSQFARAYANLALAYAYESINGWSDDSEASLRSARHYADEAVKLDTESPQIYWALGLTQMFSKDYKAAMVSAERTLALSPNNADGYGLLATILTYAGRPEEALKQMQKAIELNPRHPFVYRVIRGQIHFNLRQYEQAEQDFLYALERNPNAYEARLWLAATYSYLGRIDDAGWEIEQIRFAGEEVSLEHIEQVIPLQDPMQRQHLIAGLSKAGLTYRDSAH